MRALSNRSRTVLVPSAKRMISWRSGKTALEKEKEVLVSNDRKGGGESDYSDYHLC